MRLTLMLSSLFSCCILWKHTDPSTYFHKSFASRRCLNWNFQVIQLPSSNLSIVHFLFIAHLARNLNILYFNQYCVLTIKFQTLFTRHQLTCTILQYLKLHRGKRAGRITCWLNSVKEQSLYSLKCKQSATKQNNHTRGCKTRVCIEILERTCAVERSREFCN